MYLASLDRLGMAHAYKSVSLMYSGACKNQNRRRGTWIATRAGRGGTATAFSAQEDGKIVGRR
jgi:hypothetical protein